MPVVLIIASLVSMGAGIWAGWKTKGALDDRTWHVPLSLPVSNPDGTGAHGFWDSFLLRYWWVLIIAGVWLAFKFLRLARKV